jgi:hypothetical protein
MTQSNLGNVLRMLGERENETGRLEEAVSAYHEALKEQTRERVPLDWAMTQNNLGGAFVALGERDGETGHLEEAMTAYLEALKERTRERVPLQWAATPEQPGHHAWDTGGAAERDSAAGRGTRSNRKGLGGL